MAAMPEKQADMSPNIPFGQFAQQAGSMVGVPVGQSLLQSIAGPERVAIGGSPDVPLARRLQEQAMQQNVLAAQGSQWSSTTQQEVMSAIRGLLAFMGVDWTPKVQQQLGTILAGPVGQFLGPWLDQLTNGAFGGASAIGGAVQRAMQNRGMNPTQTKPFADAVAQAFNEDPSLSAGFRANDMAEIIMQAAQAGQLPTTDPVQFKNNLRRLTMSLAVTKDQMRTMGFPTDAQSVWNAFEQGGGIQNPERYAELARIANYATEQGGKAGLYGAAASAAGQPLRLSPTDIAEARSGIWRLLQRDWRASAAAATARIINDPLIGGFKPGSPGERFAQALNQGQGFIKQTPRGPVPLSFREWKNMMNKSINAKGITIDNIFNQSRFNKQTYLANNPALQNAIMSQAASVWMPQVTNIRGSYAGNSPKIQMQRQHALNLMAERLAQRAGVKSLMSDPDMSAYEKLQEVLRYGPQSVQKMREYANRARQEAGWTGIAQEHFPRRFVTTLQRRGKQPIDAAEAIFRLAGIPTKRELRELNPGGTTHQIPGVQPLAMIGQRGTQGPAAPAPPATPAPPVFGPESAAQQPQQPQQPPQPQLP